MSRAQIIAGLLWSQVAYWGAFWAALWSYLHMPQGSIRVALILTPILPGLLIIAVAYWIFRACDEYIRLRVLRAAALAAVAVAIFSLSYSYLELAGLPKLSMMWVSHLGWAVFSVQMLHLMIAKK